MLTPIKLQKDYTQNAEGYQLKLPLNIETIIPEDDSVRLLSQFVEAMDLTDLYSTYERINSVSPRTLLKIVLYSYMNGDYSSRSMELNCKRDIHFMFLLEGAPAPDYATFARFRSLHFAPCSKRILAEMSNTLFDLGEVSGETIFIDGTRIEASANKYTFVWKKAVTKNHTKLLIKLANFVAECEQLYDLKIVYSDTVKIKHVKKLRKKLYTLKQNENVVFVHGIGKRKTPLQKSIETLEEYLSKLKAYNLQHGVDSEYITWLTIEPQPTDTTTLIPFLKDAEKHLNFKYKNITADAGYESEENYLFLKENGQISYIKPANYEISKTRKK